MSQFFRLLALALFVLSLVDLFFAECEQPKATNHRQSLLRSRTPATTTSAVDYLTTSFKTTKYQSDRNRRRSLCPPSVVFTTNAISSGASDSSSFTTTFSDSTIGNKRSSHHAPATEFVNKDFISCRRNNPNQIHCNASWPMTVSCWIAPATSASATTIPSSSSSSSSAKQHLRWDCSVDLSGIRLAADGGKLDSENAEDEQGKEKENHGIILFGEDVEVSCFSSTSTPLTRLEGKANTRTKHTNRMSRSNKKHPEQVVSRSYAKRLLLPDLGHVKTKRSDFSWTEFEAKLHHAERVISEVSSSSSSSLLSTSSQGKQRTVPVTAFQDERSSSASEQQPQDDAQILAERDNSNHNDDDTTNNNNNVDAGDFDDDHDEDWTIVAPHHGHLLVARAEASGASETPQRRDSAGADGDEPYYCYRWIPRSGGDGGEGEQQQQQQKRREHEFCQVTFSLRNHNKQLVLVSLGFLLAILAVSIAALMCRPANQSGRNKQRAVSQVLDELEQAALAKAFCSQKMKESDDEMRLKNLRLREDNEGGAVRSSATTRITTDSYPIDEVLLS